MVTIHADFSDLTNIAIDLAATTARVGAQVSVALRRTAHAIEADAKGLCPVDTGNLRNSISTAIMGDGRSTSMTAEVGPTAEYGLYVEEGTSRMSPQPYLGPAFDRRIPELEAALTNLPGL